MKVFSFAFLALLFFKESTSPINPADSASVQTDSLNFIFTSSRSGKLEIWKKQNGQITQLTHDKKQESWRGKVSPDGKKVLFYRSLKGSKSNTTSKASLWLMNIDGSEQKELIAQGEYGWVDQSGANWSPDGKYIVMAATTTKNGSGQLYISDQNGKNLKSLTKRPGYFSDPSFSPDGKKIAFVALPEEYTGTSLAYLEVFIMDLEGTEENRLTYDEFRDHDPSWSPNGKELVFETALKPSNIIAGRWGIRIISIQGGEARNVLFDNNINTSPCWVSAERLLFERIEALKSVPQTYSVSITGTDLKPLESSNKSFFEIDLIK
ncbi:hypothetical protein NF867_08435 [Solitalea sp. MAHUQ-68]|uniref:Uncharacterized protein n=1 Tax=Solitalea agri TaxID=2953739 RepID=A0A9X2JDG3_9SPHI|nr:hypothetical protein [Solitalea agri]MCO4292885.1 hypothetical protein [Solitalea agri]